MDRGIKMELFDKIITLRPNVTSDDFDNLVIILQNDSDENGTYIKEWNHLTETKPTQEELDGIN
jgi:hypothetical protein